MPRTSPTSALKGCNFLPERWKCQILLPQVGHRDGIRLRGGYKALGTGRVAASLGTCHLFSPLEPSV